MHRVAVPWDDSAAVPAVIAEAVLHLVESGPGSEWSLYWTAGTGVVATGEAEFETEQRVVEATLAEIERVLPSGTSGTLFFASSAGATYAGNPAPPFSEDSETAPLAPYGRGKLRLEDTFRDFAASSGHRLLIGRISNLYGPGQNIAKPQGLISQLAAARLDGRPSNIYVPLHTVRDYLFVDDAGAMIVDAVDLVEDLEAGSSLLKIFAAQEGVSISGIIAMLEKVMDRSLDIVSGHDPAAVYQALDLRFRSTQLTQVDARSLTSLEEGVRRTVAALQTAPRDS
ncbi:hypothetical protein GCM10025867_37510 [Frondihabitans sucicola]|uniref:UDP-glucose 4-epimerase n=1 Tax=Frondihabitans sucicola TaxID=1268041 RepID=A0ABM8GSR6_9MICO|nr:hypothetical protein GCM10025867_37510 [Frondihabitans sucicola]